MSGKRAFGALAVLLAFHALVVLRTHGGFDHDHDSQYYARFAQDMTRGEFELAPHAFNNRFGVTVPTAIGYELLGVGRYSTTLWPLVASLVGLAVAGACAARLGGAAAGLLAAYVLAVSSVQIEYSG